MEKRFCQYCGLPLEENCRCERDYIRELAEVEEEFIEEYENRPDVIYGQRQQDMIDWRRFEQ